MLAEHPKNAHPAVNGKPNFKRVTSAEAVAKRVKALMELDASTVFFWLTHLIIDQVKVFYTAVLYYPVWMKAFF